MKDSYKSHSDSNSKSYKYNSENNSSKSNSNSEYMNKDMTLSEEDKRDLELLNIQRTAVTYFIISDLLSYEATNESAQLIYSKYTGTDSDGTLPTPDITTIQAVSFAVVARLMFINIAFTRYNILYKKAVRGEFKYSLLPNIYINTANIFGIFTQSLSYLGAVGIYQRDLKQPVFGVR